MSRRCELLGNGDVRLYDGSMAEWTRTSELPIERKVAITRSSSVVPRYANAELRATTRRPGSFERSDQVFGDAVGEVVLLGGRAQVVERKEGDVELRYQEWVGFRRIGHPRKSSRIQKGYSTRLTESIDGDLPEQGR